MARTLKPTPAAAVKRSRTEWDAFIRRRETLNEERKRLDRESESLSKQVAGMDAELVTLVESETTEKSRVLALKNFLLSIEWKKPSAMAVAFAILRRFTAESGQEAVDAVKAQLPDKPKLEITWRTDPGDQARAA